MVTTFLSSDDTTTFALLPNGSRDVVDWGLRNDSARMNVLSDHDTPISRETVHAVYQAKI